MLTKMTQQPLQARGAVLQDPFLNILRKERIPVSIFLVNGIKLQGQIESFDQFALLLRNSVSQMIYKHAISTIVPTRPVRIQHDAQEGDADYGDMQPQEQPDGNRHNY